MPDRTISVTMANYNDSHYITAALKSICEQSYPPKEVLVVDDASTDNSVEIIQNLISQYPFIRLVRNEVNRGVNFSSNRATSLATGDYIYFAAANDLVLPGFFEKSVKLLTQYPQAAFCFTDCVEIDSTGEVIKTHRGNFLPCPGYLSNKDIAYKLRNTTRHFKVQIGVPSSIVRLDLVRKDEPMDSSLQSFSDWILCQTLACVHGICYIPEDLAAIRRLDDSYSSRVTSDISAYQKSITYLFRLLASPEYKNLTPLIIYSRSISKLAPRVRNPFIVYRALKGIKSQAATSLIFHSIEESTRDIISAVIYKLVIVPCGYLKNLYDRVFARCFHQYDKMRTVIKKQFLGTAGTEK